MHKFRKILSFLLLFVMLLSFVPEGALVFDFKANAHDDITYPWDNDFSWSDTDSFTGNSYLSGKPGVYIMGDGYAIIWVTTFSGMGSVTYKGEGGKEITIYDQRNGITRTNDTIHVVKIGLDQLQYLQKDGYFIRSEAVEKHSYALTVHDEEFVVLAGPIKVAATPNNSSVDTLVLTDVHGDETEAKKVANRFIADKNGKQPGLYIFPGDVCSSSINSKKDIEQIFTIIGNITSEVSNGTSQVPSVFVRGNHECRGVASTLLLEYLPTKTGQHYFDFTYGSLWGVVIDTVEDKYPTHQYYGSTTGSSTTTIVNYERYLIEQQKWLRSLVAPETSSSSIKLGIYHHPNLGQIGYSPSDNATVGKTNYAVDITDSIHHLDLDFAVAGHNHTAAPMYMINNVYHDTFVCGGHVESNANTYVVINGEGHTLISSNTYGRDYIGDYVGTWVTLNASSKKATITAKFSDGNFFGRNYDLPGGTTEGKHFDGYEMSFSETTGSTRYTAESGRTNKYTTDNSYNSSSRSFNYYNNTNDRLSPYNPYDNVDDTASMADTSFKVNGAYPSANMQNGSISLAAQPTVFETGGEWYNIVWVTDLDAYSTSTTQGSTKGALGFVQYEYQGKTYQVFDEVSGFRRAYDNIHTVKIPKEHLNNNQYFVGSVSVQFAYVNNTALYYQSGNYYVTSPEYLFQDRSSDKTPNILNYGDLKYPTNDFYGYADEAVENLGTSPTVIVVSGNAVQTTTGNKFPSANELENNYEFSPITGMIIDDPLAYDNQVIHVSENYNMLPWIFKAAADVSDSIHPVIFSRGYTECRGMFATELYKYIPTVTGEFHYTVNYGDFTYVNMDTNEDDPTDVKVEHNGSVVDKYCERIDPDQIKRDLDAWMFGEKGIFATGKTDNGEDLKEKLIVITNQPLYHIDRRDGPFANLLDEYGLGPQWAKRLKQNGAIINITSIRYTANAPDSLSNVDKTVHERQMFTVCNGAYAHPNGEPALGNTTKPVHSSASSILVSEDSAYVTNCIYKGIKNNYTTYSSTGVYKRTEGAYSLVSGEQLSSYNGSTETKNIKSSQPDNNGTTYYLSTPSHLIWLSEQVHNGTTFSGYTFELVNDIDLMLIPFTPIGGYNTDTDDAYRNTTDNCFSGIFNGNGYKIKNLHVLPSNRAIIESTVTNTNMQSNNGLFGAIKNGKISNLTVEGGFIKGNWNSGGLVGCLVGSTSDSNPATLTNCYSNVTVYGVGKVDSGASRVGGLVGSSAYHVKYEQCANYGNVIVTRNDANAGGMIGSLFNVLNTNGTGNPTTTLINNSYNRGHVWAYGMGNTHIGGIFGFTGRPGLNMYNCYNASSICESSTNANAFAGTLFGGATNKTGTTFKIGNCYASDGYNGATLAFDSWSGLTGAAYTLDFPTDASSYSASKSTMTGGTFDDTLNGSAYDDDNNTKKFSDNSKTIGVINDGYPIHANLIVHNYLKNVINNIPEDAKQDAIDSVNDDRRNNVNGAFSKNGANLTDLTKMSNGEYMYVLIENGSGSYLKGNATVPSLSNDRAFVWKLQKTSTGFVITNNSGSYLNTSNVTSSIKTWSLEKVDSIVSEESNGRKDENNADTLYKLSLSGTSLRDDDSWNIFPIIQDFDPDATYGYTGIQNGGISSTISSLSVSSFHKALRDFGLCEKEYDSVFGNNIFGVTDANKVVVDMLYEAYQCDNPVQEDGTYMTAPDATGQLMDMKCYDQMTWEIAPSNSQNLSLKNDGTFAAPTSSTTDNFRFFIAYSLNEDGGYYLIPSSNGSNTIGVENNTNYTNGSQTHGLEATPFNYSSKDRFWIETNVLNTKSNAGAYNGTFDATGRPIIKSEVVDVLVHFDRNGSIDYPNYEVTVIEDSRFYNDLYYNSGFYHTDGFWTDVYTANGPYNEYTKGVDYVFAFDSVDVVSEEYSVCYRYFRPKVYHVDYYSNLPNTPAADLKESNGTRELLSTDTHENERDIRYYVDQRLADFTKVVNGETVNRFTDTFNVTFNVNGGTESVDSQVYKYDLASWADITPGETSTNGIALNRVVGEQWQNKGDHFQIYLLAEWKSDGLVLNNGKTRPKHVFYGWSDLETVSSDNDFVTSISPVTPATSVEGNYELRADTQFNAFWVGGDFTDTLDQRTEHGLNATDSTGKNDTLGAIAAIYNLDQNMGSNFARMQQNAFFKWYAVKPDGTLAQRTDRISGNYNSKYTPLDYIGGIDRGLAIKAQLCYSDKPETDPTNNVTEVSGAYAYSALIATDKIVDGVINTNTNEGSYFKEYPVVSSKTSINGTTVIPVSKSQVANGIISGVRSTATGITSYKVYGLWGTERILIVDNNVKVMDIDGGVSYEGVNFDSFEVVVSGSGNLTKTNFFLQVLPDIYKVTIIDKDGKEVVRDYDNKNNVIVNGTTISNASPLYPDIQYKVNGFIDGERAQQKSTDIRFLYANDIIRVRLPVFDKIVNGVNNDKFKLAAGSHLIIDGLVINGKVVNDLKVFPTYSTTSTINFFGDNTTDDNVYVALTNGVDCLIKRPNAVEQNMKVGANDITIETVYSYADNENFGEAEGKANKDSLYQNINIGPLGVKRTTSGNDGRLRFGTIWYYDDIVTENRWYREHTKDDEYAFGTYIILYDFLLKDANSDFRKYLKANSLVTNALIQKWNTNYSTVTDEEKAQMLIHLQNFLNDWNTKSDNDRITNNGDGTYTDLKINWGTTDGRADHPVGNDCKAEFHYFTGRGDYNGVTGVRETLIEYSALLNVPTTQYDREIIYIPYGSYIYKWYSGEYTDYKNGPNNIYYYSAPQKIYTYNGYTNTEY